jgi:hypothetical protein
MRDLAKAVEADLLADPSLAVELPLAERIAIIGVAHLEVELSGQPGQPKKEAAARVARLLARHFAGLTGSRPTRITPIKDGYAKPSNSRFMDMLAEVYEVLGIEASADNQAKSAIEAMEKTASKT